MKLIQEILVYLRKSKRWGLIPSFLILLILLALYLVAQSTILGPFIYTLF
jgi:hypothetical protein